MLIQSNRQARPLDAQAAVQRALAGVMQALPQTPFDRLPPLMQVQTDLQCMAAGRCIAWRPFARALDACELRLDEWDLATLAASFIVYDEPGHAKQIVGVDPASWRQP